MANLDLELARECALNGDFDSASKVIVEDSGVREAAQAFNDLARGLYNDDRNLPAARAILERGIAFTAEHNDDDEVKGRQKAMNYNLGAFCWPGWGEEDLVPSSEDIQAGRVGAAENLRLGSELGRGDGPMANAYWLVGAYQMLDGNWQMALASFGRMGELASRAEQPGAVLLAEGYALLSEILRTNAGNEDLTSFCESFRENDPEDGNFYADQLLAAYRVFSDTMRA